MGIFINAKPEFTDASLPNQTGKVHIITGATGGIGQLLAGILYSKHAKVYIAARSADKAEKTIDKIKQEHPESKGQLVFLHIDFADLSTVKKSADEFLAQESSLHVLFNNAGVMVPPQGSKTKQGYELQLGTNNLAPFLFTKLLTPTLQKTAKSEPAGTVRVVWVASSAAAIYSPRGGVQMNNLAYDTDKGAWSKYGTSKAGNIFHGAEYARRHTQDGILSVSLDPGNLKTSLWDNETKLRMFFTKLILKEPIYGVYTLLFAGFSPKVELKDSGRFIEPFGKLGSTRSDVETSRKPKSEGGNGVAEQFWDWSEKQVATFA